MTRVKKIFALTIALALVFALCGPASYAMSPRQFGAWIASALTAINITWNSTVAPAYQWVDFLSDPFQIADTVINTVDYTYESDDEFMDRSTLSIDGDKVTIDGKEYTDIWLSHDAADKFRVNAFDIENAWDIASGSEGTFVSGVGSFDSIPLYSNGSVVFSQRYSVAKPQEAYETTTSQVGNSVVSLVAGRQSSSGNIRVTLSNGHESRGSVLFTGDVYLTTSAGQWPNTGNIVYNIKEFNPTSPASGAGFPVSSNADLRNTNPFDFDWVAGTVPAIPLGTDEGMHMLVPSDPSQWSDSPATQQTINNINNFFTLNPEFSPDTDIDLSTPGIVDKLDDLLNLISNIIDLTKPSFGPKEPEPEPQPPEPEPEPYPDPEPIPYPDPDPQPGTTLPDIDWTDLFQTIKNIYNSFADGNVIKQTIANIANDIRNIIDNIKWQIEQMRDQIGDIADKIIHGNKDWFSDIVDSIKAPFLPWINALRSGVSIWHYVVEWITYITGPFVYFLNITRSINYNLVLPIYALIAGTIVIAIYRRFGR